MGYSELSFRGFINEVTDVSHGPHHRKFCFVLGAGASKSSGIKTGQELVDIWDRELAERNRANYEQWKTEHGITEENKYSHYSLYYEERFNREPRDGYNYLEKLMEHIKPSAGYVMLAHLLSNTIHNVVITTNFDHLIEDAVTYYAQTLPLVIGHEALAHYLSGQFTRPTIVKIHRDLLFDPKSRSGELETLHENWEKALGAIFEEYHPVFIGYAGNDNSLMDFLIKNSGKFKENQWRFPYWMLFKTDALDGKIAEFLKQTDGIYVRHAGFDYTLYRLGSAFKYKVPSEEDFLDDAKKRYQSLTNSIDKFSDEYYNETEVSSDAPSAPGPDDKADMEQAIQQVTSQSELLRMYREAVRLHNQGKYDEAIKIERELVEKDPQKGLYCNVFGATLHALGRYDEALTIKQKAVGLEPNNARYQDSLGITLHKMDRLEKALAAKQMAVDLEPNNPRYQDSLGITLHEMGRLDEAAQAKEKAVSLEPDNAAYQNSLGITLNKMDRLEEALSAKQKAVDLEPNNPRYQDSLGITLHEMGRFDEAAEAKEKAVSLEPDNAAYQNSLSVTFDNMGRHEESLVLAQKAVDLKPDSARYQNSLGITLHKLCRFEESAAAKQKAVDLEPGNAQYQSSLGITLHRMGRLEEAAAAKQKAVDMEPDNEEYRKSLKRTLEKLNK